MRRGSKALFASFSHSSESFKKIRKKELRVDVFDMMALYIESDGKKMTRSHKINKYKLEILQVL